MLRTGFHCDSLEQPVQEIKKTTSPNQTSQQSKPNSPNSPKQSKQPKTVQPVQTVQQSKFFGREGWGQKTLRRGLSARLCASSPTPAVCIRCSASAAGGAAQRGGTQARLGQQLSHRKSRSFTAIGLDLWTLTYREIEVFPTEPPKS